jgi:hypothetical protein
MLTNVLSTINDVLHSAFPQITVSEMRLEYQRIQMGTSYCLLGGAGASTLKIQFFLLIPSNLGTFFLLVVIACSSLKTLIKNTSSSDILRIANNIRCPDPGELYIHSLILLN